MTTTSFYASPSCGAGPKAEQTFVFDECTGLDDGNGGASMYLKLSSNDTESTSPALGADENALGQESAAAGTFVGAGLFIVFVLAGVTC